MVDHVPANSNDTVLRCAGIERGVGEVTARSFEAYWRK
jgi:hypothetical protein